MSASLSGRDETRMRRGGQRQAAALECAELAGMDDYLEARFAAGLDAPLVAPKALPEQRDLSMRSLMGLLFGGVTAAILLLPALATAIQAPIPRGIQMGYQKADPTQGLLQLGRAPRLSIAARRYDDADNRSMDVPAIMATGDHDLLRNVAFRHVRLDLSVATPVDAHFPPYDPTDAADRGDDPAASSRSVLLYGESTDGSVLLRSTALSDAFDLNAVDSMSNGEAERQSRETDAMLLARQSGSGLPTIDPVRFGKALRSAAVPPLPMAVRLRVKIVGQNMTVFPASRTGSRPRFIERTLVLSKTKGVEEALTEAGMEGDAAKTAAAALIPLIGSSNGGKDAAVLRIGLENGDAGPRIVRITASGESETLATIALDDAGVFVAAPEPVANPSVLAARRRMAKPADSEAKARTVYDAINGAALAYHLPEAVTRQIVRLLSNAVDFNAPLATADRLELFFSEPKFEAGASHTPEIYFARYAFGASKGSLYRYEMSEGGVGYFGPEGLSRSALLMRKPLARGVFKSGFGMRQHPILGGARMHSGVDWAAPAGSPIAAAGSGVVEAAGWHGEYGRQTVIRHANGYTTSYSHQSVIMPDVVPGAFVAQGQVIGLVGATGLATGPHLHYEVAINGNKVDPLRVRLPQRKTLRGPDLDAFLAERDRIDALLYDKRDGLLSLASSGN